MLSLHSSAFQQESRLYLHHCYNAHNNEPTTSDYQTLIILRDYSLVVEPFSIRDLAADCPILIILKHSHLIMFQIYVVVYKALRSFQQFNGFFFIWITPYRNYYVNSIIFSQSISYIH